MTRIDDSRMQKLCDLVHLKLTQEEFRLLEADLERIVEWMDQLKDVDTTGVEPLYIVSRAINRLEADQPDSPLPVAEVLKNAPVKDSHYIHVPKN